MMPEPVWPAPAVRRPAWRAAPELATKEAESSPEPLTPAGSGTRALAIDPAGQAPANSKPQKEEGKVRAASPPIVNTNQGAWLRWRAAPKTCPPKSSGRGPFDCGKCGGAPL